MGSPQQVREAKARQRECAKAHVSKIRAETLCKRCGGQPIDWHNEEHNLFPKRRIATMVGKGYAIPAIDAEISMCIALCRSCHMKEDGRLKSLKENQPFQKGTSLPPRDCSACGKSTKPNWKGMCRKCYDHRRNAK